MEFDHIGIATQDATGLAETFGGLFDVSIAHEETFDSLQVVFLDLGGGYLELLEPLEGGTVRRFLDREGPGLHHVAVRTGDIDAALAAAGSMGVDLIDEEPRPGAWGHRVAFLHPKSTGGVLVEFVEH